MPKIATDYTKTIIYKFVCNDLSITETYVGHTTNFIKRKCSHKKDCNKEGGKSYNLKLYQTIRANGGWDNWSMIEICKYPCSSNEEARAEERRHYELLNATLNSQKPYFILQEYQDNNKKHIQKYQQEWRNNNKEKTKEYHRQRYLLKKEEQKSIDNI
jgi:hypothetical protein